MCREHSQTLTDCFFCLGSISETCLQGSRVPTPTSVCAGQEVHLPTLFLHSRYMLWARFLPMTMIEVLALIRERCLQSKQRLRDIASAASTVQPWPSPSKGLSTSFRLYLWDTQRAAWAPLQILAWIYIFSYPNLVIPAWPLSTDLMHTNSNTGTDKALSLGWVDPPLFLERIDNPGMTPRPS